MDAARKRGICADGYRTIREAPDREALIRYYLSNPDWCISRGFPDLPTLADCFSDCADMGVYVNVRFNGQLLNDRQIYIFHNCTGCIRTTFNIEKAVIPMLYVANGCRLRIIGAKPSELPPDKVKIPVYIFGKNDVSARCNRYVSFTKFKSSLVI